MKILAIETSCDETAIAILECTGNETSAQFRVLGNALLSQAELHARYGGVFPSLAKREHAKNLVPILEAALEEASTEDAPTSEVGAPTESVGEDTQTIPKETRAKVAAILTREPELCKPFLDFISESERPNIDVITVTAGPGLEPALWVGINFAKALALTWNKPLVAVNHMEGHILAALAESRGEQLSISNLQFPILALLISGGHTELVLMKEWLEYELIGQTRDDAVGEAYDKVARMLGLPYPGGPEISRLAEAQRELGGETPKFALPRPMINSGTCDFSFAGLKTAVLYMLKNEPTFAQGYGEARKKQIAHEFENAVAEVLWKKTTLALEQTSAQTLVIGGGVSANIHIRRVFKEKMASEFPDLSLQIPAPSLTTDNAVMIALAGFYRASRKEFSTDFIANGNLHLI